MMSAVSAWLPLPIQNPSRGADSDLSLSEGKRVRKALEGAGVHLFCAFLVRRQFLFSLPPLSLSDVTYLSVCPYLQAFPHDRRLSLSHVMFRILRPGVPARVKMESVS